MGVKFLEALFVDRSAKDVPEDFDGTLLFRSQIAGKLSVLVLFDEVILVFLVETVKRLLASG